MHTHTEWNFEYLPDDGDEWCYIAEFIISGDVGTNSDGNCEFVREWREVDDQSIKLDFVSGYKENSETGEVVTFDSRKAFLKALPEKGRKEFETEYTIAIDNLTEDADY